MQKLIRLSEVSNSVMTNYNGTSTCHKYFNGTLHITTDRTYHKLYHAGKAWAYCKFIRLRLGSFIMCIIYIYNPPRVPLLTVYFVLLHNLCYDMFLMV